MDFVITTFCNLNCPNCSSLMCYYKKPFHLNLESIKVNLRKLSDCSKVENIQIIGGETLLHPNINDILIYLISLNFDIISVYTNGTFIPDGFEDVLSKLDNRFTICITEYDGKSNKLIRLIKLCEKYGVRYSINTFGNIYNVDKGKEWIVSGPPIKNDLPKINPNTCDQMMSCFGDKVYRCQRFGHLDQLGVVNLNEDEVRSIDDIDDFYDDFLIPRFSDACSFCLRGTERAVNVPKGS